MIEPCFIFVFLNFRIFFLLMPTEQALNAHRSAKVKKSSCQDKCFTCGRWIPPVFISGIVAWSYYAYVVNLCFGYISSTPTIVVYLIFYHIFLAAFVFVYYKTIFSKPAPVPDEYYPNADVIISYHSESDHHKRRQILAYFARSLPVSQRNVDGSEFFPFISLFCIS